jgi:small-conductance mechanosensitive channel
MTDVQVSYGSDLDQVNSVLLQVGSQSEYRFGNRPPRVLFRSFDDSGITVTLALPIRDAVERHQARSAIIMDIWRAFKRAGIEIPFPQRDVHVKALPLESASVRELFAPPDGDGTEDTASPAGVSPPPEDDATRR